MTQEQWMILIRDILKVGGSIAGVTGISVAQIDQVTGLVLSIAGPAAALAGIVWGQLRHTPAGIVSQASALPEVKEISVTTQALATAAKQADATTRVNIKPQF